MTARDLYDEGWKLNQVNSLEGAVQKYRAAIVWSFDRSIETWLVRRELTSVLMRQRKYEEAEEEVLRLLSDNPPASGFDGLSAMHADILYELGRYEESAGKYRFAVQHSEQKAMNYLYGDGSYDYEFSIEQMEFISAALRCFYMVGDYSSASHLIEFLCSHQSVVGRDGNKLAFGLDDDASMEEELAGVLFEIAERHTAHEYTTGYVRMPVESCTQCLQYSLRLNPLADTFLVLGRHLQYEGHAAEAVTVYREMESLHSDEFDCDGARTFGLALQATGLVDEAEEWLRSSAFEYLDDFYELEPLITFYGQYQRWEDAREVLEKHIISQMFKGKQAIQAPADWAWSLHARCCELIGDLEKATSSRIQANMHREQYLREQYLEGVNPCELGIFLKSQGRDNEAEAFLLIAEQRYVAVTQESRERNRWSGHLGLGRLYEEQGNLVDAEVHFREAIRVYPDSNSLELGRVLFKRGLINESEAQLLQVLTEPVGLGIEEKHWLGKCFLAQGRIVEAEKLLAEVAHYDPFDSDYAATLEECRLALKKSTPPTSEVDFHSFVDAGRFWLEPAGWRIARTGLLARLFDDGAQWADSSSVLFTDFDVSDDDLDDALARAVAVSLQIRLAPDMPVKLQTEKLEVLLDLEGQFLRAWVGRNQVGVSVTVDISTWELYYAPGDRDAMFAIGTAINYFLDCSIALKGHPKFRRLAPNEFTDLDLTSTEGNVWTVQSQFDTDVEQILSGRMSAPPKPHRVRGHVRRLGDGLPSTDARENAPPYIRRHMSPDETWVRGHSRGGDTTGVTLLSRLYSYSSLADFLATAQRA